MLIVSGCLHDPQNTENNSRDVELTIEGAALTALHLDEQGRYVFLADVQQRTVHFLDTGDLSIDASVEVNGPPIALDTSANSEFLAVAVESPGEVAIIEVASQGLFGTIDLNGSTPTSIAFDASNRLYVGVDNNDDTQAVRIFDLNGQPPWPEGASLSVDDGYIAGRSRDRSVLYTSDEGRGLGGASTPIIRKWNLNVPTPEVVASSDVLFGSSATVNGWVLSTPGDSQLLMYGQGVEGEDGEAFDEGILPVYDSTSLAFEGELIVRCQPVAAAVTFDGKRILVAHSDFVVNSSFPCEEAHHKDIHIYDAETFTQVGTIAASDFVRPNGLVVGEDQTVYALLGNGNGEWDGPGEESNRLGIYKR